MQRKVATILYFGPHAHHEGHEGHGHQSSYPAKDAPPRPRPGRHRHRERNWTD